MVACIVVSGDLYTIDSAYFIAFAGDYDGKEGIDLLNV